MIIFYRYSDGFQSTMKPKLDAASKEGCFEQFLRHFPTNQHMVYVIADSICEGSYEFLKSHVATSQIIRTEYKSGAYSFLHAVKIIIESPGIPEEAVVYLVEDDYVHIENAATFIMEGLSIADYCTLYDHPDKYTMTPEPSEIFITKHRHWRTIPSTTMTFATTKRILKEDWDIYVQYCHTGYPYDHEMFLALQEKGRRLVSCIPGASTHAELRWLSPFVDWRMAFHK